MKIRKGENREDYIKRLHEHKWGTTCILAFIAGLIWGSMLALMCVL